MRFFANFVSENKLFTVFCVYPCYVGKIKIDKTAYFVYTDMVDSTIFNCLWLSQVTPCGEKLFLTGVPFVGEICYTRRQAFKR